MDENKIKLLVAEINERITKHGDKYLRLLLKNKDDEYISNVWKDSNIINENIEIGDVIDVSFNIREFKGKQQIELNDNDYNIIKHCDIEDFSPFCKVSSLSKKDWIQYYKNNIEKDITDNNIKELIEHLVINNDKFFIAPAAKIHHHNFRGGLAEHINNLLKLAVGFLNSDHDSFADMNKDAVYLGIIFHDYMKIYSYKEKKKGLGIYEITQFEDCVGHLPGIIGCIITTCYEMFGKSPVKIFGNDKWMLLENVLLSHHGKKEKGSPVNPVTKEACFVSMIDDFDAKLHYYENTKSGERSNSLGYNVYKF